MFNDFSSLVLVGSSVEGAPRVEHLVEIGYFLQCKEGITNKPTNHNCSSQLGVGGN